MTLAELFLLSITVLAGTYLYLGVKHTNWIAFIMGLLILALTAYCIYHYTDPTFTPEYELEIIDQDSVRIRSLSTGRIYTERYDQVQNALLKDNL